jgi:hypothetical protein
MSDTKRIAELTQRIAELGDELARVKAESLRVVPVGDPCRRTDCGPDTFALDSMVYFDQMGEYRPKRLSDGGPVDIDWDCKVQPVRLVRWEGEP